MLVRDWDKMGLGSEKDLLGIRIGISWDLDWDMLGLGLGYAGIGIDLCLD
jgi:hypothetical protein